MRTVKLEERHRFSASNPNPFPDIINHINAMIQELRMEYGDDAIGPLREIRAGHYTPEGLPGTFAEVYMEIDLDEVIAVEVFEGDSRR